MDSLIFAMALSSLDAAPFSNGSFESPASVPVGSFLIVKAGHPDLSPWLVGGTNDISGVAVHNGIKPPELDFPAVDGSNSLVFNPGVRPPGDWISQDFDTISGEVYQVTFYVGRLGNTEGEISLTASTKSATGGLLASVKALPPAHGYGTVQRLSFTATTSISTIEFRDTSVSTAAVDLALDNVAVNVVQLAPSTDDLWDVSRGAIITGTSKMNQCSTTEPFDARNIFGGNFAQPCDLESPGSAIFADGMPAGFVHYVEWAMPSQVTIRSFKLWALGSEDQLTNATRREMGSFRLLAKSPGSSTFDITLYAFSPNHPYTFIENVYGLLIASDTKPFTAREFRAEFVNLARTSDCCDGPRILELDGFGQFIGPKVNIRVSEAEVSWASAPGLNYQVEYREDAAGSNWNSLGSPVGGDGTVIRVTDKVALGAVTRFYQVREVD